MTTKKHFKQAAELIKGWEAFIPQEGHYVTVAIKPERVKSLVREELTNFCSRLFNQWNPRFDEARFRKACEKD